MFSLGLNQGLMDLKNEFFNRKSVSFLDYSIKIH
jgi:hypothetical protein